jgi:hypothetical protein
MQAVADNFPIILTAMLISLALCWWGISHYFIAAKRLEQHEAENTDATSGNNNQFASEEAVNRQTLSRTRAMTQTMKGGRISAELKSFAALQNQIRQKKYQHRAAELSSALPPKLSEKLSPASSAKSSPTTSTAASATTEKTQGTRLSDRRLPLNNVATHETDTTQTPLLDATTGKAADLKKQAGENRTTASSHLSADDSRSERRRDGDKAGTAADGKLPARAIANRSFDKRSIDNRSIDNRDIKNRAIDKHADNQRGASQSGAATTRIHNPLLKTMANQGSNTVADQTPSPSTSTTNAASGVINSETDKQLVKSKSNDKSTSTDTTVKTGSAGNQKAVKTHEESTEKVHHAASDTGIKIASAKDKRATESVERKPASPAADSNLPRVAAYQTPGLQTPSLKSATPLIEVKTKEDKADSTTAGVSSNQRQSDQVAKSGHSPANGQGTEASSGASSGAKAGQRAKADQGADSDLNAKAEQRTSTDLNAKADHGTDTDLNAKGNSSAGLEQNAKTDQSSLTSHAAVKEAAKDTTSNTGGKSKFGRWFAKSSERQIAKDSTANQHKGSTVAKSIQPNSVATTSTNTTAVNTTAADKTSANTPATNTTAAQTGSGATAEQKQSDNRSTATTIDQGSHHGLTAKTTDTTQPATREVPNSGVRQTVQNRSTTTEPPSTAKPASDSTAPNPRELSSQALNSRALNSQELNSEAQGIRHAGSQISDSKNAGRAGANANTRSDTLRGKGSESKEQLEGPLQGSGPRETELPSTESESQRADTPGTTSQASSAVSRLLSGNIGRSAKKGASGYPQSVEQAVAGDSSSTKSATGNPPAVNNESREQPSLQVKPALTAERSTTTNERHSGTQPEASASTAAMSAVDDAANSKSADDTAAKKPAVEEKYQTAAKIKQTPSSQEAQLQLKPADISALSQGNKVTQDANNAARTAIEDSGLHATNRESSTGVSADSDKTTDTENTAAVDETPRFTGTAELEKTLALEARDQQIKELNARIAELEAQQHRKTTTAPTQSDDSSELKQKLADTAEELKLSNQKVGKLQSTVQALQSRTGTTQTAPLAPAKVVAHNRAPLSSKVRVLDISSVS